MTYATIASILFSGLRRGKGIAKNGEQLEIRRFSAGPVVEALIVQQHDLIWTARQIELVMTACDVHSKHNPADTRRSSNAVLVVGLSQQTRDIDHVLVQCWASVADDGPTLNQQMVNVPCLLGRRRRWGNIRTSLVERLVSAGKTLSLRWFNVRATRRRWSNVKSINGQLCLQTMDKQTLRAVGHR